jgi:DNA modification methylase
VYRWPEWLVFGFPFVARAEAFTGLLVWDKRGDGGEGGLGNPVEVAASNAFNGYRLSRHVWAGYVREAGEKREPHPTQKPVGIMVDAIGLVRGDAILDPFLGSGTTMVAAQNLGRKCYGLEISPAYCSVILQRMQDAFPGIEIRRDDGTRAKGGKAE